MNLLIIGDIHGCYYTFQELLDKFWDSEKELLIQVGDIIDRGKFSPDAVSYCKKLSLKFPNNVIFLKGNHEFEIIEHYYNGPNENWLRQCGKETIKQYENTQVNIEEDIRWFSKMPLYWSNEKVFVSHAGIAKDCINPLDETNQRSVLWNRDELKNIGKLQVIGHTPCKEDEPFYDEKSNTWNIDTGSGYGGNLTALRLSIEGNLLEIIKIKTLKKDSLI
ncbi:MAG: serine/threonine protein phosphatase [Clostridia bacterium]|jgi:serine/threonine protein phosphatase 1|nr:serine/threonine protein phosphatase [Clostridia bacterium]